MDGDTHPGSWGSGSEAPPLRFMETLAQSPWGLGPHLCQLPELKNRERWGENVTELSIPVPEGILWKSLALCVCVHVCA